MPSRSAARRRRRSPVATLLRVSVFLFLASLLALGITRFYGPRLRVPVPDPLPDWITVDLLPINDYSRPGTPMDAVNGVVIHYVGNPGTTAQQNRSYFAGLARSRDTSASSNFLIGLDGEVLLCVPIGEVAYCSNDRNHDTLSIEVCHPDDTGEFTPESYASLVRLVQWLADFYDLKEEDILRHYDIRGKECPRYFVRQPEAWEAFKADLALPS